MILPKINYALFDLIIPSNGMKIQVRQIIAKDEKILLMAKASTGDGIQEDILNAVRQVVNNCIITPGVDVDHLALFDIEFLFLKLRAISISNMIKVAYQDNEELTDWREKAAIAQANKVDVPTPPKPYEFEINLDKVEVKFPEDRSMNIDVGDGIHLKMKYPDSTLFTNKEFLAATGNDRLDFILQNALAEIDQGSSKFNPANHDPKEVKEFLDNLPVTVYDKIRSFIATLPTLFYELKYTNRYGKERVIPLQNLSDFFMF